MVYFINGLFNGARNKNALYKATSAEFQSPSPGRAARRLRPVLFAFFSLRRRVNALISWRVDINFNSAVSFYVRVRSRDRSPEDRSGSAFLPVRTCHFYFIVPDRLQLWRNFFRGRRKSRRCLNGACRVFFVFKKIRENLGRGASQSDFQGCATFSLNKNFSLGVTRWVSWKGYSKYLSY